MADALVSALVNTIMRNLNSTMLQEFGIARGLRTKLEYLKHTFRTIQAVLHDAEEKQWKSDAIKVWLRDLKDVAYDAEDLLDEFSFEAQWRHQRRDLKSRVRSFFSRDHNPLVFRQVLAHKLNNMGERLDAIAKERQNFHLREGIVEMEADSFGQRQTWSYVNESEIYGRGKEKEDLINMLITSRDDFSVYAICGMGGLGKTTLAQLVYSDASIEGHFNLRIWVCVSVDFDIKRLIRAIIESIEGTSPNIKELDTLQRHLRGKLNGTRFLLVLDDVWDDNHDDWSRLKDLLKCGGKGSTVIVTTRLVMVADNMATTPVHHIEIISDDDSWLLFEQFAFGIRRRDQEYTDLEEIGMAIVKKCGGVPLAIRALGSLLRLRKNISDWLSIKESEIWDLPNEGSQILPALSLSYTNLEPHLKQCFAYCSIFPKDHVMLKERLLALWMANGFISCNAQMDLHDKGNEVFYELVGRSFFQEVTDDGLGNITCKMHDLIHDLAQSIMKHECYSIEGNAEMEQLETIRHVALCESSQPTFNGGKELQAVKLRSFVFLNDLDWPVSYDLPPCFFKQKHLRALDMNGYDFNKLPEFVCKLKYLRYLDVSRSSIKILPESITSLHCLQTLNLRRCVWLQDLPKRMKNLKNLMYLDNTDCCSLRSMPVGMGQLTCLRKLSIFVVGKNDGHQIGELAALNLGGELSIKHLGNVKSTEDARKANLMEKINLQSLSLFWGEEGIVDENYEEVISGLQPHSNLKKLTIDGFGDSKFPNWMMHLDLLLPNLVDLRLEGCGNIEQFPPLGKMRFLKYLVLWEMHGVKCIGSDVYGDGNEENNPFPSLEALHLGFMDNLVKWETVGRNSFPRLRKLIMNDCSSLVETPIIFSLKTLDIGGQCSSTLLSSVNKLTSLTSLDIRFIPSLMLLPDGMLQNLTLLENLDISGLSNLKSLSNLILDNLFALKSFEIWDCEELESLPEEGFCSLSSLETLEIHGCEQLSSLPDQIRHLRNLSSLTIWGCPNLRTRCEKEIGEDWPKIANIPFLQIDGQWHGFDLDSLEDEEL